MLQKLALAFASALVTLLVLELAVRGTGLEVHDLMNDSRKYGALLTVDETGGYFRHPLRTSVHLQGVTLRFNSLGMRDDEPRLPKPPGTFRLLLIGDSMALGPGVAQDAIYPARLRALLARDGLDVVAAGVGGWNTVEEEEFLAANIDHLAPDLVVLLYVTNDNDVIPPWRRERQPPARWPSRLYRTLVLRSRLFEWGAFLYTTRLAAVDWSALREMAEFRRAQSSPVAPFTDDDVGWRASLAALGQIDELAHARGARLAVFLFNMGNGFPAPTVFAGLRRFGAPRGVPVSDTSPFFAGRNVETLVNGGFDRHPNAEGHALLAEGMARTLTAERLVP